MKLYLNHPDGGHQEFLRAGAARVILAIRAGYEEEVVSLLDKGRLGKLTEDSRFLPIIEKVQKANERLAKLIDAEGVLTNGNGDGDDGDAADNTAQPRLGERIGRWEDWTDVRLGHGCPVPRRHPGNVMFDRPRL